MKRLFCLFITLLLSTSCKKQQVALTNDLILTKEYASLKSFQKKKFLDSISLKLPSFKNDSVKINYLFEIAAAYYYLNDSKSSFRTSTEIYRLALENHDSVSVGRSLYYMGDCYENYRKDSAYYYYKESEKIFRNLRNKEKIAKALFNKAHLLFKEGNYTESEIEVTKALQELQYSSDYDLLYQCYYLQSCNHTEFEEYDYALNYLKLAQESLKKYHKLTGSIFKLEDSDVQNIVALCNIYDKKGDYKRSIALLNKLLTPNLKKEQPVTYSIALGNLAYSNMKEGNLDVSKKQFVESITMSKKLNSKQGYLFKIIHFGEYYLTVGDTTSATHYFDEALPLAKRLKMGNEVLKTLQFLARSAPEKASFYQQSYVTFSDSIIKHQRLNSEKFSRIEYETNKVQESNKVLSTSNLYLLLLLLLSVALFLVVLLVTNWYSRKKELVLIYEKQVANDELFTLMKDYQSGLVRAKETEQNRISKELHDGVVNQIYAIRMVLETLNKTSGTAVEEKRLGYIKGLHNVERAIRDLSHELHSDGSESVIDFDFLLTSLLASNNAFSSTVFTLDSTGALDWEAYSSVVKLNLYRIIQELLLNVNKHAGATRCEVKITTEDHLLKIVVCDDGIGVQDLIDSAGIGHKNIKERLQLIGAVMTYKSNVGAGSEFTIVL